MILSRVDLVVLPRIDLIVLPGVHLQVLTGKDLLLQLSVPGGLNDPGDALGA